MAQADSSVVSLVSELLEATGMHLNYQNKNFIVTESDTLKNTLAIAEPLIDAGNYLYIHRYIVYDRAYMQHLMTTCSPAAMYVIFSHEITHHLNGDNFMDNDASANARQRELAADSFAGFLCYKMSLFHHFTLQDCLNVYETVGDSVQTKTYPDKKTREKVFSEGWYNSQHFMQLSCQAANQLEANPAIAINEFRKTYPDYTNALANRLATVTQDNLAKTTLSNNTSASSKNTSIINLREDTSLYVTNKKGKLVPLKSQSIVSEYEMKLTTTVKLTDHDTSQYIIDNKNIIWAKYPNGVPYIAGYRQALK